ncbi:DUF4326 domain-containing protein [soil metagenome]
MSDGPKRIQLSRVKGWRLPDGAVKVDRSTMWGNPYRLDGGRTAEQAVEAFRLLVADSHALKEMAVKKLRGHDLACWCAPDAPCHADVLLEIANG